MNPSLIKKPTNPFISLAVVIRNKENQHTATFKDSAHAGRKMKKDLKARLAKQLEPWALQLVPKSYEVIGNIVIIRTPEALKEQNSLIAEAIMQIHQQVTTVLRQAGAVSGDFRLRKLEWIAGDHKTETLYKEHACLLKVNLATCYFSPRLSYERMRIAQQIQPQEVIINMFAGVGSFSIIIAKHSQAQKIYSLDLNPTAIDYLRENSILNKVTQQIIPIQGDAKTILKERLQHTADRILMPLPEKAYEYIDYATSALKPAGGWIHYYGFEHAKKGETPTKKHEVKISEKLHRRGVNFTVAFTRIVRRIGPNWFQIVLDIHVRQTES